MASIPHTVADVPDDDRRQFPAVTVLAGPVHQVPSGLKAVQEIFRRWPTISSRELQRIRRALLDCQRLTSPGGGHQLSEPALALLELVTDELNRRGQRRPVAEPPGAGGEH